MYMCLVDLGLIYRNGDRGRWSFVCGRCYGDPRLGQCVLSERE